MLSLLLNPRILAALLGALLLAGVGIQTVRLNHAKHDLAAAKAELAVTGEKLALSEKNRAAEYQNAVSAVSEADKTCADRVETAHRSAQRIHTLTEKPVARDPKTDCPIRGVLGADELRAALEAR